MDFITYYQGKKLFVKDKNLTWTSEAGKVERETILNAKNGDILTTSKEKTVTMIEPLFVDKYRAMKRGAQAINLKDCGVILAETLVGKNSTCLDCGAGMGGLTCFLARYVKKVYSLDFKSDHLKTAIKNAENLGLTNVEFMEHDIYLGIPKKNLDLITLDVQMPESVVKDAKKALKIGGFLVAYCPQVTQMHEFCKAAKNEGLYFIRAMEVGERNWKVFGGEGKVLRPEHVGLMHTGFLAFFRKIEK